MRNEECQIACPCCWLSVGSQGEKRETGQIPREPCQHPVLVTQLLLLCLCGGEHLSSMRSCSGGACWPFGSSVTHQPLFPLPSSTQELLVHLGMSCCASALKSSHTGMRQVLSPFFGLNITWFISEEVVAFHCANACS